MVAMNKLRELFTHVAIPLLAGIVVYYIPTRNDILIQIRNYLPDGLWAYSFTSCVLIIWDRAINMLWLSVTFCQFVLFEYLQSQHIVKGTGDASDVCVYFVFGMSALIVNQYIQSTKYFKKGRIHI